MASNLTEVGDAIQNLNISFENITSENILNVAIQNSNAQSDGWVGITVFALMCISVLIFVIKNKASFQIIDKLGLIFIPMSIWLDLGIQLLVWGILESLQIFTFIYTVFFVACVISLLRKEMISPET